MARDYTVGQRPLFAACGIAIAVVGSIVEKRHLISDFGIETLLWLLTVVAAAFLVLLAIILIRIWRTPKLDEVALAVPPRSDRWIAAQAKVLARRQRPSGVLFLWPMTICCFLLAIYCLWAALDHLRKSAVVGPTDVLGVLGAAIFLVIVLLAFGLWRGLRDSERALARALVQRSSKAIDS
jgi:hypothetical protein